MDELRATAEQAYAESAFDFVSNPIGSRDWTLFWSGYQACASRRPTQPAPAPQQDEAVAWKERAIAYDRVYAQMVKRVEDAGFGNEDLALIEILDNIIAIAQSKQSKDEAVAAAVKDWRDYMGKIGGCSDGACMVKRPEGMHTNGGCRCYRDSLKAQRFMSATHRLIAAIESAGKGEG